MDQRNYEPCRDLQSQSDYKRWLKPRGFLTQSTQDLYPDSYRLLFTTGSFTLTASPFSSEVQFIFSYFLCTCFSLPKYTFIFPAAITDYQHNALYFDAGGSSLNRHGFHSCSFFDTGGPRGGLIDCFLQLSTLDEDE